MPSTTACASRLKWLTLRNGDDGRVVTWQQPCCVAPDIEPQLYDIRRQHSCSAVVIGCEAVKHAIAGTPNSDSSSTATMMFRTNRMLEL